MGDVADVTYLHFINLERREELLAADPSRPRLLPNTVPAKFAVLLVLSKKCFMSVGAVKVLLKGFGYLRSSATLRRALQRCLRFGFVVRDENLKRETGVLKGRRNHRHHKWALTERGRQMACSNPKAFVKNNQKQLASAKQGKTCVCPTSQRSLKQ